MTWQHSKWRTVYVNCTVVQVRKYSLILKFGDGIWHTLSREHCAEVECAHGEDEVDCDWHTLTIAHCAGGGV